MKTIKFLFIVIPVVMSLVRCAENDTPDPTSADSLDVPLTDDQAAFLATLEDTVIHLEDIFFENGQNVLTFLEENDPDFLEDYPYGRSSKTKALTPFQQKNLFFSRMYVMGYYLTDDSQHTYPSDGVESPAQTGLVYSWGSKDYNIRQVPPGLGGQCLDLKIYGLDCNGMLWSMTQAANLRVEHRDNFCVQCINSATKWTNAFKASADYKDLEMKDMGEVGPDKIRNGDIIFWDSHVGVFLYGWFYQSNGNKIKPGCDNNLQRSKGPRMISLASVVDWGLGPYKVFRVIHEHNYTLTVKYKDNLACGYTGQIYQDSVEVDVKVKEEEVSVSNIVNHTPNISPLTIPIVGGCDLTCDPGSLGIYNVTSGSGKVPEDGSNKFEVDLVHAATGTGGFGMIECPGAPPIIGPGPTTVADHTENFSFILADSVQRQGTPTSGGYGVFITLTPK